MISNGKGFIIQSGVKSNVKKDMKEPFGIYSPLFGMDLQDVNPYMDKYKCRCGDKMGSLNNGIMCDVCGTRVRYVGDDFFKFGWIVLKDPYWIIHPNLYKSLQSLIGETKDNLTLTNILRPADAKDMDGHPIEHERPPGEPYYGIGILEFKERIDEILDYYYKKKKDKEAYYIDIKENMDKLFTQSIPVYTTHLRPSNIHESKLVYENTNGLYYVMSKFASQLNASRLIMQRKRKVNNTLLWNLQSKYMDLYKNIESIIKGKKGTIRQVFGGRYTFSLRAVMTTDPSNSIDEIGIPYYGAVEFTQQTLINILHKTYNYTFDEAYRRVEKAKSIKDELIEQIIYQLIETSGGLPCLLGRNPTLNFGSILFMYIIKLNDGYNITMSNQVLELLAGDYDGDEANVFYIINKRFKEAANRIFNPRNNMYISKNDGLTNIAVIHNKDVIINMNSFLLYGRKNYTPEDVRNIIELQRRDNLRRLKEEYGDDAHYILSALKYQGEDDLAAAIESNFLKRGYV
jgi:DNA-directed RNA polymerase beta' subunit